MPDLKEFLDTISKKDWSSAEAPITKENENDRAMPWMLQGSANVTCAILEEYHKWILKNYDIKPKN